MSHRGRYVSGAFYLWGRYDQHSIILSLVLTNNQDYPPLKVCIQAKRLTRLELILVSVALSD